MRDTMQWWGYVHVNGSLQAKRFFFASDMDDARESPFVAKVVGPFFAKDRDHALQRVAERAGE